ncbi:MAG: MFS transporter, partial [Pseudomonadota bacterium]
AAGGAAAGGGRRPWPPLMAATLGAISLSLMHPLFSLLLERAGLSGSTIGLNAMAAPVGMVLAALLLPGLLARLGLATLTCGALALAAATAVLVPLVDGLPAWTVLRFTYGLAVTALFYAVEFWIIAAAPEGRRGRAIGLYGICTTAAFTLGPLGVYVTGSEGVLPFAVAGATVLLGIPAIALGAAGAPGAARDGRPGPFVAFGFFRSDPTLLIAILLFGVIEFGTLSLLPVWGLRTGFGEDTTVTLVALFALGAMALQGPLGWAADRYAVRPLLAAAAFVCVLAPLMLIAAAPGLIAASSAVLVWGGFGAGLYTLALAGLGARYSGQRLAEAQAALNIAYGIGALAAPAAMGIAMDRVAAPHGLLLAASLAAAAYLALTLGRMVRVPR